MLVACSTDSGMMNEYDRISANFKEQINGNIDRSHLWRTMVTLHVRVTSDEPITLYACSQETDDQVILFDKKEQETAGGTIDLVVPQGYGNSVVLYVVYKGESYKREIELTGIPTQVIDVDTDQLTDELPSVSTAKNQSVSASFLVRQPIRAFMVKLSLVLQVIASLMWSIGKRSRLWLSQVETRPRKEKSSIMSLFPMDLLRSPCFVAMLQP